jgi:hypothetical protein
MIRRNQARGTLPLGDLLKASRLGFRPGQVQDDWMEIKRLAKAKGQIEKRVAGISFVDEQDSRSRFQARGTDEKGAVGKLQSTADEVSFASGRLDAADHVEGVVFLLLRRCAGPGLSLPYHALASASALTVGEPVAGLGRQVSAAQRKPQAPGPVQGLRKQLLPGRRPVQPDTDALKGMRVHGTFRRLADWRFGRGNAHDAPVPGVTPKSPQAL